MTKTLGAGYVRLLILRTTVISLRMTTGDYVCALILVNCTDPPDLDELTVLIHKIVASHICKIAQDHYKSMTPLPPINLPDDTLIYTSHSKNVRTCARTSPTPTRGALSCIPTMLPFLKGLRQAFVPNLPCLLQPVPLRHVLEPSIR